MLFTTDELTALAAMVKTFKCPVCGNTHIKFDDNVTFRPFYAGEDVTQITWQKTAAGRCTWCGMIYEFDMEQVMASARIMHAVQ